MKTINPEYLSTINYIRQCYINCGSQLHPLLNELNEYHKNKDDNSWLLLCYWDSAYTFITPEGSCQILGSRLAGKELPVLDILKDELGLELIKTRTANYEKWCTYRITKPK